MYCDMSERNDSTRLERASVHRACDACSSRKIKCDGKPTCQQCAALNLWCTYSPKLKRSSLLRNRKGAVLSRFRKSEAPPLNSSAPINSTSAPAQGISLHTHHASSTSLTTSLYDGEFIDSLVAIYMQAIYPLFPVMTEAEVLLSIDRIDKRMDAAFIHALAALIMGCTGISTRSNRDRLEQAKYFSEQSLEVRGAIKSSTDIDIKMIMTSCFLSSAFGYMNDLSTAWMYLHEAITMLTTVDMYGAEKLSSLPLVEQSRRQRLYWTLYIQERSLALRHYRPVTMVPSRNDPQCDTTLPAGIHDGFLQLIRLFRLVDIDFINGHLDNSLHITAKWIAEKESRLMAVAEIHAISSEIQKLDLALAQEWLRLLLWRMAATRSILSPSIPEGVMSIYFPRDAARRLRSLLSSHSKTKIQAQGTQMTQNLFEFVERLCEFSSLIPSKFVREILGGSDDFIWIVEFLLKRQSLTVAQNDTLQKLLISLRHVPDMPMISAESTTLASHETDSESSTTRGLEEASTELLDTKWENLGLPLRVSVATGYDNSFRQNNGRTDFTYDGPLSWIAALSILPGSTHDLEYEVETTSRLKAALDNEKRYVYERY